MTKRAQAAGQSASGRWRNHQDSGAAAAFRLTRRRRAIYAAPDAVGLAEQRRGLPRRFVPLAAIESGTASLSRKVTAGRQPGGRQGLNWA